MPFDSPDNVASKQIVLPKRIEPTVIDRTVVALGQESVTFIRSYFKTRYPESARRSPRI